MGKLNNRKPQRIINVNFLYKNQLVCEFATRKEPIILNISKTVERTKYTGTYSEHAAAVRHKTHLFLFQ